MLTLLAFLGALLPLVTIHELGHYSVARYVGVRIEQFSVGFGKAFFSRVDRHGTKWCLAPIPLGGYVKMLDTYEAGQPEAWRTQSFSSQTVGARMAIVAAGPVSNFLFAMVLYAWVSMLGVTVLESKIGAVMPNSIAAKLGVSEGERVLKVGEESVTHWRELHLAFSLHQAKDQPFSLETDRQRYDISPHLFADNQEMDVQQFGILPTKFLPKIAGLDPNGAAKRAGLKEGDEILAINGAPISSWRSLMQYLDQPPKPFSGGHFSAAKRPIRDFDEAQRVDSVALPQRGVSGGHFSEEDRWRLTILRNQSEMTIEIVPTWHMIHGKHVARLGFMPASDSVWLESLRTTQSFSFVEALFEGVRRTIADVSNSFSLLKAMIFGKMSTEHLGGPIAIANMASHTAERGVTYYLEFLAVLSVSLGFLNLLPIPVLDGGHLLYCAAEWIRGKPLSARVQAFGQSLGMAIIFGLMCFALFNDINRFFSG